MKKHIYILLICCFASVCTSFAENYFRHGFEWEESWYLFHSTPYTELHSYYLGESQDRCDKIAYPVYRRSEEQGMPDELTGYFSSEGEKVYGLNPSGSEWFLVYDFGMEPGQENIFLAFLFAEWNDPEIIKAKMRYDKEINVESTTGTLPGMEMTCIYDLSEASGNWIKGIGCTYGITYNTFFGLAMDASGKLVCASFNGELLYENPEFSSVSTFEADNLKYQKLGSDIKISGLRNGSLVSLINMEGNAIDSSVVSAGEATLTAPRAGIYLIQGGNSVRKIVIN